jgi:hypothetical protein
MYAATKPKNERKRERPQSSSGYNLGTTNLTLRKYAELDDLMTKNVENLKKEVERINYQDYLAGNVSLSRTQSARIMPIKVLDSII